MYFNLYILDKTPIWRASNFMTESAVETGKVKQRLWSIFSKSFIGNGKNYMKVNNFIKNMVKNSCK